MQSPDGSLKSAEQLKAMMDELRGDFENEEDRLHAVAQELTARTGKPHPVFRTGEVVELKGGKWKVQSIMSRGRMLLKAVPY